MPKCVGVVLLFFDRLESAARGALEIAGMDAAACDLMDRRLLSIARDVDVRYDLFIPRDAEAMLLVEMQGDTPDEVRQRMQNVVVRIQRRRRLAFESRTTLDPEEVHLFWQLAHRVVPSLYSLKGSTRPLPFVEDIVVPPGHAARFPRADAECAEGPSGHGLALRARSVTASCTSARSWIWPARRASTRCGTSRTICIHGCWKWGARSAASMAMG